MGYGHPTIMGNPYIGQYGNPIFMGVFDHPFVWKVDEDKHVFMNQNPGTLQTNSSQTMVFHHRF